MVPASSCRKGADPLAIPRIRFDQITKSYGGHRVIDGLSLDIAKGEFISLLGPSGSGKTTLLMILAGFEAATGGGVWLDGERIDHLPPHRRDMGVVFQNYALFPHMTVAENIAFPLQMRGLRKAEIAERVRRALDMVQLGAMSGRYPAQLSGGQQQRIALARALVFEPAVVLMDEPLGALDKQLREQMQLDIRKLHMRLGLTVVFVTHDQSEALTMSDRIAVFNKGVIEQIGTPREIYDHPATRFVAEFIGETNLIEGTVERVEGETATVRLPGGGEIGVPAGKAATASASVLVSVRPERIHLGTDAGGRRNALHSTIVDSVYQGDHLRVQLDDGAHGFIVHSDRRTGEWMPGAPVVASFQPDDCWVIAP
ncbi:ABC transporter ATP-binding protein [Pseudochelatococcus sp. B33]